MWILLSAVVTASLLGSLHCVGMCGPLAIWASGAGEGSPRRQLAWATSAYHAGRMLTYTLAGLLAGAAGQLVDSGGQALGVQLVAARIVGTLMVAIGVWQLVQLFRRRFGQPATAAWQPGQPSLITRVLVKWRPFIFKLPIPARGLVTGLLTALLPCGWLYLFALVAAGTGSMVTGPLVMFAFWLGTVPALVALVSGTQALAMRFRRLIPAAAAVLLVVGGCYTAAGRGFAKLHSLSDIAVRTTPNVRDSSTGETVADNERMAAEVGQLAETPLPCCVGHSLTDETPLASPNKALPTPEESDRP
jgi:sulfite exporter TauE/SafE